MRPRITTIALAVGVSVVPAVSRSSASTHARGVAAASAPLPSGAQGSVGAIPWARVGPGWLLGLWGPDPGRAAGPVPKGQVAPQQATTRLYLVDPAGGRYLVTTIPPPAFDSVVAWSGDGRRALIVTSEASGAERVAQIDLATGRTTDHFVLGAALGSPTIGYSAPKGLALLVSTPSSSSSAPATLVRETPGGRVELRYPTSFPRVGNFGGTVVSVADGTALVLGAAHGLAVVSNAGVLRSTLVVAGAESCSVLRWWSKAVALGSCAARSGVARLYEVPLGGAVRALTAAPKPPDFGDLDAWQVGAHVYLQSAGACGYEFLSELGAHDSAHKVRVPGVQASSSVIVLGTASGRLALQATVSCGTGQSLAWFDPAHHTTSVVLGPPVNGGGVIDALAYPTPAG